MDVREADADNPVMTLSDGVVTLRPGREMTPRSWQKHSPTQRSGAITGSSTG